MEPPHIGNGLRGNTVESQMKPPHIGNGLRGNTVVFLNVERNLGWTPPSQRA